MNCRISLLALLCITSLTLVAETDATLTFTPSPSNTKPSRTRLRKNNEAERTLALIKPDGVAAKHTGDIIELIENNGLTITRIKKLTMPRATAKEFYAEHAGKPFFNDLMNYMTSGPIMAMELQGPNAVATWRALMGATDPKEAAPGTIRRMFAKNKSSNVVHGSMTCEDAQRESALAFGDTAAQ